MYTSVHVTIVTILKRQKKPKCPSKDKYIRRMWYIHTTEYYSSIKVNEMLIYIIMWFPGTEEPGRLYSPWDHKE